MANRRIFAAGSLLHTHNGTGRSNLLFSPFVTFMNAVSINRKETKLLHMGHVKMLVCGCRINGMASNIAKIGGIRCLTDTNAIQNN